jgi:hypothetical protein
MAAARLTAALLGLAAVLLAGCNPAAKAIGKWEVETDKVRFQLPASGENVTAAVMASMSMFVQVHAELEIKADNTWTWELGAAGNVQSLSGTWRFVKSEGDTLVLAARPASGGDQRELKLKFVDDDHVQASGLLGEQVFPLKRKTTS